MVQWRKGEQSFSTSLHCVTKDWCPLTTLPQRSLTTTDAVVAKSSAGCCLENITEVTDQVYLPSTDSKAELTYSMQQRCGIL